MSIKKNISGEHAPAFVATDTLFGHPKGLMILFFTEMWERFSYYGMRGILVLFLVSSVNGGFGWSESEAINLYGWYTMLVYLVSIPGGIVADKLFGQKKTVMLGGFTLVAGHFLMALPDLWAFYVALGLIIAGTGMLKPNISTMVGGLYKPGDSRRDSGFTIFYMGINLGAFLAALIVGYVGETIGWHYGFSLAGIGMLLGQVVFIGGQKYLKGVGDKVKNEDKIFTKEGKSHATAGTPKAGYSKVEKDRLVLLGVSFIIVLIFWAAFEQAGGLMNLYTKKYTDRYIGEELAVNEFTTDGTTAVDSIAITEVKSAVENKRKVNVGSIGEFFSNLVSPKAQSFEQLQDSLNRQVPVYSYQGYEVPESIRVGEISSFLADAGPAAKYEKMFKAEQISYFEITANFPSARFAGQDLIVYEVDSLVINPIRHLQTRDYVLAVANADSATYNALMDDTAPIIDEGEKYRVVDMANEQDGFIVPASWFQSLNAFFILTLGGVIAALWLALAKRGKNPPSIFKMGIGTAIMGCGFIFMVFAAMERETSLFGLSSMWWLVLAYLFHTIGELALSPVALSYITKLAPQGIVASVMGIYFAVTGLGNKLAAELGVLAQDLGEMEIFGGIAAVTIFLGLLLAFFSKKLNKLSHGAEDKHEEEKDAQTGQLLEAGVS